MLRLSCHDDVLAEFGADKDALGAQVEFNSRGVVTFLLELYLVLEEKLRLVRVLEVHSEHVIGVDCYQNAVESLREWRLIHTKAQATVDFKVTCEFFWQGSEPISPTVPEHCLHNQVFLQDLIETVLDESDFKVVQALKEVANFVVDDDHLGAE